MSANAPTLINLPPHDGVPTPSDMPGTPNSTTTSMSELSTVAIKDGHRGHLPHTSHAHHPTAGTLDAERADRISRLAGLERVATARNPTPLGNLTPGATAPPYGNTSGYFDAQGNPVLGRERSTVGSASATGSVGGRTTWASGSDVYEQDKMSESQDMDVDASSVGGISDTNSLVAFGEGARTPARYSGYGSPSVGKATPTGPASAPFNPAARDASLTPVSAQTASEQKEARYLDGMTYDGQAGDSANAHRAPEPRYPMGGGGSSGTEAAERILHERLGSGDGNVDKAMESPDTNNPQGRDLGKFYFENR